jgi:hypothetical protein
MLLIAGQVADDCELDVLASWSVPVQRHGNLGALPLLTAALPGDPGLPDYGNGRSSGPGGPGGNAAAITTQTAMNISGILRILAPRHLDADPPSIYRFLTRCQLIRDLSR